MRVLGGVRRAGLIDQLGDHLAAIVAPDLLGLRELALLLRQGLDRLVKNRGVGADGFHVGFDHGLAAHRLTSGQISGALPGPRRARARGTDP